MLWLILFSCMSVEKKEKTRSLDSITSLSFPAYFLSQTIIPDVQNSCLLPFGEDALHWSPDPEQIAELQDRDMIVRMGMGYEAWVNTASLPTNKMLTLSSEFAVIPLDGQTHSHGSGGTHQHHGMNPYVWLDPLKYSAQLSILEKHINSFPSQDSDLIHKKVSLLDEELQSLSTQLASFKEKLGTYTLAADSQRFAYLAKAMELDIHPFDFPTEEDFRTQHIQNFMSWYSPEATILILWSYNPSLELIQKFPENVRHLYFDPLVQPVGKEGYDYVQQFTQNIKRLSEL